MSGESVSVPVLRETKTVTLERKGSGGQDRSVEVKRLRTTVFLAIARRAGIDLGTGVAGGDAMALATWGVRAAVVSYRGLERIDDDGAVQPLKIARTADAQLGACWPEGLIDGLSIDELTQVWQAASELMNVGKSAEADVDNAIAEVGGGSLPNA